MSETIDEASVRHTAKLARLAVSEDALPVLVGELRAVLGFISKLSEVDVSEVDVHDNRRSTPLRDDVVTAGNIADDIIRNAPAADGHFFTVPKVIE